MTPIGEFFAKLGFDVDDKKLKEFNQGIKDLGEGFLAVVGSAVVAAGAMTAFVADSARAATNQRNLAIETGLATDELQKWAAVANAANPAMGMEKASQSIKSLQQDLVQIQKFGKGNIAPFQYLGLDATYTNPFEVLQKLREKSKTVDAATLNNLLGQLHLEGYQEMLSLSDEEFTKFMGNIKTLSPAAQKSLSEFDRTLALFTGNMQVAGEEIASRFAPQLQKMLDWISDHAPALGVLALGVSKLGGSFKDLLIDLVALRYVLGGSGIIGWLGSAAALLPWVIGLGAVAGALYELYKVITTGKTDLEWLNKWFEDAGKWLAENVSIPLIDKLDELNKKILEVSGNWTEWQKKNLPDWFTRMDEDAAKRGIAMGGKVKSQYNYLLQGANAPISNYGTPPAGVTNNQSQKVQQNTFSNTLYIDSNEDSSVVAEKMQDHLQRVNNHALSQIGNGGY